MFATRCMKHLQPQALQVGCLNGMTAVTWTAAEDAENTGRAMAETHGRNLRVEKDLAKGILQPTREPMNTYREMSA
jgi:hypothetical protein